MAIGWPGVLQPGLTYTLTFAGLAITSVSVEGLLFAFEAALVSLLAWPLLGETPSRRTVAIIAVGTIGVLLVSRAAPTAMAPPLLGVILILAGVAGAALDTVASRHLAMSAEPLTLTAAMQVAGLATVAASAPFWDNGDLEKIVSAGAWWSIALSGILIHGFAPWLFNASLRTLRASEVAAILPLTSLITVAGGVLWLGESLSAQQLVGGVLVFVSAAAATRDGQSH